MLVFEPNCIIFQNLFPFSWFFNCIPLSIFECVIITEKPLRLVLPGSVSQKKKNGQGEKKSGASAPTSVH